MAGGMDGLFDAHLQQMAILSSAGRALGYRLAGLGLILAAFRGAAAVLPRPGTRTALALAGITACLASFTMTGHTATAADRSISSALLVLHLTVVAFWFGALLPLRRAAGEAGGATAAAVIARFSKIALWLVPLIAFAGTGLAFRLIHSTAVLGEPYGRLLLLKIGLFCVLLLLGALNKWRLAPAIAHRPAAAASFRKVALLEYGLICAVLAATAVMTTFYSPEAA